MARVLLISKPVVPPWNDSGKNLVRDLACALPGHDVTVLGVRGGPSLPAPVRTRHVYPARGSGFAPGRLEQARVFAFLGLESAHDLWHYFFAPNPPSCLAGRTLRRLRPRPTVHTVSSAPRDPRAIVPKLFADVHVVLSAHTERRLREAGLSGDRIERIPPSVPPMERPAAGATRQTRQRLGLPTQAPLVLFPGDLEFGEGAELCIEALQAMARREAHLVMACRDKTPAARAKRVELRERVTRAGLAARVHWLGETPDIHALLSAVDVVTLPSRDLFAKMDYPLVLLEAMALQRPVAVVQGSAAAELAEGGAAVALEARAEALAQQLDRWLEDEGARAACGRRAAQRVRDCFAPAVMARAYAALYDRLL